MENSKIIRYCERCRETIDNSNFKKYGNFARYAKSNKSTNEYQSITENNKNGFGLRYLERNPNRKTRARADTEEGKYTNTF